MQFSFGQNIAKIHANTKKTNIYDWLSVLGLILIIFIGTQLAVNAPAVIKGPEISLDPAVLPWYSLFSVSRMVCAYLLSIIFSLIYGRIAAYNQSAERFLIPVLDILQSVPILSFLPVVLLGFSAFLPLGFASELAAIVLIFTSQAWNLTFAWYQSLTTIPKELQEASSIFKLNSWSRFTTLELPFAMISLIWNSMMSWAGGWFFLMAAEIFTVGQRDFRLPGLGAYLHQASSKGDFTAIAWGLGTLIIIIVLLDQVIWRPLIAWSDRFKVEMVENDNPPTSWFYDMIHLSRPGKWIRQKVLYPIGLKLDELLHSRKKESNTSFPIKHLSIWVGRFIKYGFFALLLYGSVKSILILANLGLNDWNSIGLGVFQTALRMVIVLILALAWTIPVGVLIGTNTKVAAFLQPVIQITASVPATALFPVMLIFFLQIPGGLNLAAIVFMLMGTQWYLLFNVIAGAMSIPQDLKYTASMMRLGRLEKWKTLILPALFPYLITGAITASGGAWNASIVAEYVTFRGEIYQAAGIGSIIASSTAEGNYPLLFAATSSMILAVVLINRLVWRPLYRLAEESYRME